MSAVQSKNFGQRRNFGRRWSDRVRIDRATFHTGAFKWNKGIYLDILRETEFSAVGKLSILGDGATGANGLLAVRALSDVFYEKIREREAQSAAELQEIAGRIVRETKNRIDERAEELRRSGKSEEDSHIATTFSSCIIASANPREEPKVFLSRLGDSGFVASYSPSENAGIIPLARASQYGETTWISSYEKYEDPIRWSEFNLKNPGYYEVLLYSDGIHPKFDRKRGKGDEILTEGILLSQNKSIFDLLSDIHERWPQEPESWVGMDDISITAFGISVEP